MIVCRSLTYAQKTAKILEKWKIKGDIVKTPLDITGDGCGYSVKISGNLLNKSLDILKSANISFVKLVGMYPDGHYFEVRI